MSIAFFRIPRTNKFNTIPTYLISRLDGSKMFELDQRQLLAISIPKEKPLGKILAQFLSLRSTSFIRRDAFRFCSDSHFEMLKRNPYIPKLEHKNYQGYEACSCVSVAHFLEPPIGFCCRSTSHSQTTARLGPLLWRISYKLLCSILRP